ncbi:MAG: helix-turn-helix domain-containing protein [Woeseiaceae bacterium]|nr:helix-turn-helix domain-containing protein [Woeseiaceae bacterium]
MLLLTAALAVLLALPMALRRQRRTADVVLAGFILTQGLAALYYVFLFSPALGGSTMAALRTFSWMPIVVFYTLQGPLLLWYSRAITGEGAILCKPDVRIVLSVLGFAIFQATAVEIAQPGIYARVPEIYIPWVLSGVSLIALIVSVGYGLRAVGSLRAHGQRIRDQHSNIDDIDLLWLKYTAIGFTAIWSLRVFAFFAPKLGLKASADFLGTLANFPTILLVCWMVALGLSQRQYASGVGQSAQAPEPDNERSRSPNPALVRKLEHLMDNVRVYQDPDLDVEGLADSVGISPRSLSALINGHYGINFYDFVNSYRVSEAKRLLQDPDAKNMTIQRVFETAGFSSKSTFNTFFKKITGKTPSEFRRLSGADRAVAT